MSRRSEVRSPTPALISSLRLGDLLVYWLAAGEAFAGVVPVGDSLFTQFPAKQHGAAFHLAGEIEQPYVDVFHLDSGGVNFGERVLYPLDGFLALRFAPRHLNDVHQQAAAEKDAMGEVLEFGVHAFDQLLAIDRGTQQRFQNRQKAFRLLRG